MDFDKMIEGLSYGALMQLRDKCEIKLNKRTYDHEQAIREAIQKAYAEGFTIYFSRPDSDDESNFFITGCDYHVEVE